MESKKKEKELFPVTTSRWNSNIEKNIKEIGESCKGYKWMHITSTRTAMRQYNVLMYITISIGPIAGLFETISISRDECDDGASILQILIIVFGFVSGVLASIVKFSNFNQKSVDHKTAAAKYTSLEQNIRRQLSLYRDERVNAGKYLQWVSVSFDDLFSGSPLVSDDVYKKWATFAQKHNIFVPKEYGILVEVHASAKINALANVCEIKVNNSESSADLRDRAKTEPDHVEITEGDERRRSSPFTGVNRTTSLKRNCTKRTAVYTAFPEMNKFADPRMQYELGRMFGMD